MATIILSHDVKDFSTWKSFYLADSPRRTKAGVTSAPEVVIINT
jgi:hypothetical protein